MENTNLQGIHQIDSHAKSQISYAGLVRNLIIVLVVGVVVGFVFAQVKKSPSSSKSGSNNTSVEKTAGIVDKKTFKDSAEGILKEGGIDGEGNFHLDRPGGVSQNAYLTSSTVDLSKYIGKKVRVWGVTFQGQKAGWLMDVGFVEVI
jgi:hypothetical protein